MTWKGNEDGTIAKPPKIYFFESCYNTVETFPALKYITSGRRDDLDTDMQDDFADSVRYAVVKGYGYPVGEEQIEEPTDTHPYYKAAREEYDTNNLRISPAIF